MTASSSSFRVTLPAGSGSASVSARLYRPAAGPPAAWVALAHGAGAGQSHPFMVGTASAIAERGCSVITFDFPYIERGRRAPDPRGVLESCWIAVLDAVRQQAGPAAIVAGGKSMGGRIASQVAAHPGVAAQLAGLVFLGYPLHPPGKPDQRRTAHWPQIHLPALFVQGTRDPFASPEELRESLSAYAGRSELMLVEGGDHSFAVPRTARRDRAEVLDEIHDRIVSWIRALPSLG